MFGDVVDLDADPIVGSARADIARLSLQLRAALHDATVAEEIETRPDLDADQEDLKRRLERLLEARRRELAAEIQDAHADATRIVSAARQEAASMVTEAEAELATLATRLPSPEPAPATQSPPPAPVLLDTEALTQAVAAAVAVVLAQRLPPRLSRAGELDDGDEYEPVAAFAGRRLLHLDVMLPLIAVAIVLVVLLAWVG